MLVTTPSVNVRKPLIAYTTDDLDRVLAVNLRGTFYVLREAGRHMAAQGSGVILVFGGEGDPPRGYHLGALQTALHAVEAMRRAFSVTLNAPQPRRGPIRSPARIVRVTAA